MADLQLWPYSKICLKRVLLFLTCKTQLCFLHYFPWLRHLIDLSMTARMPHRHITMNVDFIFGPLAHSVTPLSYLITLIFSALHLAIFNSLSPALPILNTLLLAPYPDGKELSDN